MDGLKRKIGSNMSEISYGIMRIFYSYTTPVAGYHVDKGWFRTKSYYSRTTSNHINKYLRGCGSVELVDQEWIDSLI